MRCVGVPALAFLSLSFKNSARAGITYFAHSYCNVLFPQNSKWCDKNGSLPASP